MVPWRLQCCVQHTAFVHAGTAVGVCPVGSLTYQGSKTIFGTEDSPGAVCQALYDELLGVQTAEREDKHGWVVPLSSMPSVVKAAAEQ